MHDQARMRERDRTRDPHEQRQPLRDRQTLLGGIRSSGIAFDVLQREIRPPAASTPAS